MRIIRGMSSCKRPLLTLAAIATMFNPSHTVFAQAPASPAPPLESIEDLTAHLNPEQKHQFDDAMRSFNSHVYADALPIYKSLLQQLQGDAVLTKLATEAALNTGDTSFALSALRFLAAANPNDWQATALLARACAESGDKTCRDTEMAHMLDLRHQGITPPRLKQYLVERVPVGENTLVIQASLEPWGRFNVYDMGLVLDREGKALLRITLESDDGDQGLLASEHPKEAAAGVRRFSFDGYRDTVGSNEQPNQTHYTYKLLVGQPSYDSVRENFISIAKGGGGAVTSSTRPIAQ